MYIVDTNVVSELRKQRKTDPQVLHWFRQQSGDNFYLSVITILEAEQGFLKLQRYDKPQAASLRTWIDHHLLESFSGRILSIDTQTAQYCARMHVPDRKSYGDGVIAATALVHNFTVVTRNMADFESTGAKLLNPWLAPHQN